MESKIFYTSGGNELFKILYNDEWMTFTGLSKTSRAICNKLSPNMLKWRWFHGNDGKGIRTENELLGPKDKRSKAKPPKISLQKRYLFSDCSEKMADACISGTNNDLMRIDSSRPPFVTPGEKRRMEKQKFIN